MSTSPVRNHVRHQTLVDGRSIHPRLNTMTWRLRVHGVVQRPLALHLADLHRLVPAEMPGGSWFGPTLAAVIALAGLKSLAQFAVLTGADGYSIELPIAAALSADSILGLSSGGELLLPATGAPVYFANSARCACFHVPWLTEIMVTSDHDPNLTTW